MNENYIPQRGIDFDDFIGTLYFANQKGLENVQFTPLYCAANGNHSDNFIGIGYKGYATNAIERKDVGKLVTGIMYPARNFTEKDVEKLFDAVEAEDGTVSYRLKGNVSLDEVYIRVCYAQTEGKEDTIKWVAAVDGGEVFTLSGDRRVYNPKDAEQ